jgi:branched-chain amino acid transport system ATP-binding protein
VSSPILSVAGATVAYGAVTVLHGVDFAVDSGEIVALLGTNGAGKSTLLKAISGITPLRAGSVHLDGHDLTRARPRARVERGIVQVPGGRGTFPGLTIAENLRLGARLVEPRARAARVAAVHQRFPWLADRAEALAGSLSGGQQQILAVARALIAEPRVLMVDELSLGLAPAIVGDLVEVLFGLRDDGTAVVLVEQQIDLALDVADRAYFLERGAVQFDGAAEGLRGRTDLLRAVFLAGAERAP